MATSLSRLSNCAVRCARPIIPRRNPVHQTCRFRTFYTTPPRRSDDDDDAEDVVHRPPPPRADYKFDYSSLDPDEKASYDALSPEEKLEYQSEAAALDAYMTSPEVESELNAEVSQLAYELSQEVPRKDHIPERIKPGLMAMGEEDEQGSGEDGEFKGDDISSLAHGELEQHREIREMARIAAWEMPLLSSMVPSTSIHPATYPMRAIASICNGGTEDEPKLLILNRTRQNFPTSTPRRTTSFPPHNLHGRNPPRRKKDRPRILHLRPTPHPHSTH